MIALCVGLRGKRTEALLDDAVSGLTQLGQDVDLRFVDNVGDLASTILDRKNKHIIAFISDVDVAMAGVLSKFNGEFFLLYADPVAVAIDRFEAGGDIRVDIRDLMRKLVQVIDIQAFPNCITIDCDRDRGRSVFFEKLAELFSGGPLTAILPPMTGADLPVSMAGSHQEIDIMARGALSPFRKLKNGSVPDRFLISRQLFVGTSESGAMSSEPLDVTGRARLLVFGPYVHLPRGHWSVRMVVGFSEELIGNTLVFDVSENYGADVRCQSKITVSKAGRSEIFMSFQHDEPSYPVEVRTFSERSIIDGYLSIGFVEFTLNKWPDELYNQSKTDEEFRSGVSFS